MRKAERRLESEREWGTIVSALSGGSVVAVARQFGVTPGDLAAALVRTRTSRQAIIPEGVAVARPPQPLVPKGISIDYRGSSEPAADETPGLQSPVVEEARSRAPAGKMDEHIAGFRAAALAGNGRAFLVGIHRLVVSNLRRRIARDPAEAELLAQLDRDMPDWANAVPTSTTATTTAPPGAPREARGRRAARQDRVREPPSAPAGPVEGDGPPPALAADHRPSPATDAQHHVYVVGVLLGAARRDYGVVASSMAEAIALAVARTGGTVVQAQRQLEALQ